MKINKKWLIAVVMILLLFLVYLILPDASKRLGRYGKIVFDRKGKVLRTFLNSNEQWCFQPQANPVSPNLKEATLLFEDQYFYTHPGFNPVSIVKALIQNVKAQKVVSGGSTITMQVCRLAYPGKRTLLKKMAELFLALKLEIKYNKEDILSLYLNNAPYGGNIIGVRAASLKYFRHEPDRLSDAEAALLAVLPNAPGAIMPGTNQSRLIEKRNTLLEKMLDNHLIEESSYELSCLEPAPNTSQPMPCIAPHFTRFVNSNTKDNLVSTTIDIDDQLLAEKVLNFHFPQQKSYGIKNTSALVVDNQTREILVWIGSQDYYDTETEGKVDGVIAHRSAGSTLKPFLYALAIDDGLITPESKILDVPTYFPGFHPRNSSRKFTGWSSARYALTHSLNVPAVRLLNLYGYTRFYNFLQSAGITSLFREPDGYGLTLIIGGCEISMLELTALYSGLANLGNFKSLKYQVDQKSQFQRQLVSPGAAWQILNILTELDRPENEFYWHQYDQQWRIAWKTGTSYGHRDAWAIGCNPQYTVAVWTGNFDNESNQALSGASSSAPLMFAIFNALPKDPELSWFNYPLNELKQQVICAETGLAPSRWCPRDTILVPKDAKPLRLCHFHQPFQVTKNEEYSVCSLCWKGLDHHNRSYLIYPPQVKKYLELNGKPTTSIPPHLPHCPSNQHTQLTLIYPQEGDVIFLPMDINNVQQKLIPQISGNYINTKLFWYLDDNYLGTTTGKENIPLLPASGQHVLSIIDQTGHSVSATFHIKRN